MRASLLPARRSLACARVAAIALLLAAPCAARAAEAPDPAALEAQVRDWLAGLLGPEVKLDARPVQFAAEGDHLLMTVPVAGNIGKSGVSLQGPPFTAQMRRLDDGRWAMADGRLPSPLRIADLDGHGWTVTLEDQTQRAVLDPTLATASTWDGRVGHYVTASSGPGGQRESEARNVETHLVWQPAGNGRVDVRETTRSELIASNAHLPHAGVASFSAGRSEMTAHIEGLSPARIAPLLQAALHAAPALGEGAAEAAAGAASGKAHVSPQARAALDGLLPLLADLLHGAGQRTRFDNVHLHAQGFDLAMRRLEMGGSIGAPGGRLQVRMELALDGLDSGALAAAGPMRAYVPHHLVWRQSLGGVPASGLMSLLQAAAHDAPPSDLTAQGMALLQQGPLAIGLEEFATDLGPASLSASGTLRIAGPAEVTGQADIRATGLDALIAAAQTDPMLKQALPVLIFLKGIGQTQGTATVWAVAYQGGRLTVNGTDMSQMMPAGH